MTAFLDGSPEAELALVAATARAAEVVAREFGVRGTAGGSADPDTVAGILEGWPLDGGASLLDAIDEVGEHVVRHGINVAHPHTVAHLHCPPLIAAVAAEVVIAAMNQSLDSWDQGPTATQLEQQTIDWMCAALGYGPQADGVFTSGGTQSNFMGLLIARDRAVARHGRDVNADGLGPEAASFRILCAQGAHFSVLKSARQLGLGGRAVVPVAGDADGRMTGEAAAAAISRVQAEGHEVIALSATSGTTDLGAMDPLEELAPLAREHDAWLHVDAAVGGVLVCSERERQRLAGIEQADSVTVDFHKLWFQPVSCGAFVVRDRATLGSLLYHADYLNPEPVDDAVAFPNLVDKSLQTTRRFDALKLALSLRVHGSAFFGQATEKLIDLTRQAGELIKATPGLELAREPGFHTLVFRHEGDDALNLRIRRELLLDGRAVLAQTRLDERTWLKITLMNPETTLDDVRALLDLIVAATPATRS